MLGSQPYTKRVSCCRELQRNGIDVVYCGDQEADSFLVCEAKAMMATEKTREVTLCSSDSCCALRGATNCHFSPPDMLSCVPPNTGPSIFHEMSCCIHLCCCALPAATVRHNGISTHFAADCAIDSILPDSSG